MLILFFKYLFFIAAKDEKVGNFPVRMLVILVKLCKVIEYKKQLVGNLTLMNDYAEQMNLMGNEYPEEFKVLLFIILYFYFVLFFSSAFLKLCLT